MIKCCCRNLEHDSPTVRNDLSGQVNQAPADRVSITTGRYHRSANVFFEGFKQKMTQQHRIIPGGVGVKHFKGQLLVTEVLQRPVGQFITAAVMITGNNGIGTQILVSVGRFEPLVDLLPLADVGDDDRIRPTAGKVKLLVVIEQPAVQRPSENCPAATPGAKCDILAGLFCVRRTPLPQPIVGVGSQCLDVLVNFTAANVAELQLFTELENLLIKKTAVHPKDTRHIRAILFANDFNDLTNHF